MKAEVRMCTYAEYANPTERGQPPSPRARADPQYPRQVVVIPSERSESRDLHF